MQTKRNDGTAPSDQEGIPRVRDEGFTGHPLTSEQRKALGVEQYYRPFRVDAAAALKGRSSFWIAKRGFDIIFATLALVVLSPIMLICLAAIWIEDPKGSPIFCQTRVGRHRKEFKMYKFRTMHVDAEARKAELQKLNEKDGPVFKMANDPRVTRVGRFLRKTSLDELPQLFNVLRGDMTLVGPRPALPSEVEQYSRYAEMRLSITPGLTCIWQAQPKRDEIGFDEWMDMDIAYIGTRSFRNDMKLLLKTAVSMLRRSGS